MNWDEYFLAIAEVVASKSKDPSTKVGCVIVRPDHTIVSTGFNGFPRGLEDDQLELFDRELKLKQVLHSEENAILFSKEDLYRCNIYTTLLPCPHCALQIIQSGIFKVFYKEDRQDWHEETLRLFDKTGVEYEEKTSVR